MLNRIQAAMDMDGRISSVAPAGAIGAVTSPMRAAFRDVDVKTATPSPGPKSNTGPSGLLSPRVQKALTHSRNRRHKKSLDRRTPEIPAAAKRVSTKYLSTEELPTISADDLKAKIESVRKGNT